MTPKFEIGSSPDDKQVEYVWVHEGPGVTVFKN